jgi:hypothetical protein
MTAIQSSIDLLQIISYICQLCLKIDKNDKSIYWLLSYMDTVAKEENALATGCYGFY